MRSKRVLALALALVVLLGGCNQYPKTAATYDGGTVPAGVYIYYQAAGLNSGQEMANAESWAMDEARVFVGVEAECARREIAVDESTADSIKSSIDLEWTGSGEVFERNGIGKTSVIAISHNETLRSLLFEALYGELGEEPVEDAELEELYRRDYRRALMLVMPKYDEYGSPLTGDKLAEYEARVAQYRALADSGLPLFEMILRYDEWQHETSGVPHEHGDLVESEQESIVWKENTTYPADLLEQLFGSDERGVRVYDGASYTVFYDLRELMGDGMHYLGSKSTLRQIAREDTFRQRMMDAAAGLRFTPNEQAVKGYKPDKLNFS